MSNNNSSICGHNNRCIMIFVCGGVKLCVKFASSDSPRFAETLVIASVAKLFVAGKLEIHSNPFEIAS